MGVKVYSANGGLKYKYSKSGLYSMQLANNVSSAVFSGAGSNSIKNQLVEMKNMDDRLTDFGQDAFSGCAKLSSVTFNDSLGEISRRCFSGCVNLAEAFVPPGVAKIGDEAFSRCRSMPILSFKHFENDDAAGEVSYRLEEIGEKVLDGAVRCGDAFIPSSIDDISKISAGFLKGSSVSSVTLLGMTAGKARQLAASRCFGLGADCTIYTSDGKRLTYSGESDSVAETAEYSQYDGMRVSRGKKDKMALGKKVYHFAEDLFRWCAEPTSQDPSKFPQRECPAVVMFLDLKTSVRSRTFADNVLRKTSLYKWMKENLACYVFMMDRDGMVSDSESSSDLRYYRRVFSAKGAETGFVTVSFCYGRKFSSVVLDEDVTLSEFQSVLLEYCQKAGFGSFNPDVYDKIGDEPDPETMPQKSATPSEIARFHTNGFDWYANGNLPTPSKWNIDDDPMDFGLVATPDTTYLLVCTYDEKMDKDPVEIETKLFPILEPFSDHAFFYKRCHRGNAHFLSGLAEGIKYRYLIFFEFSHGSPNYITVDGGVTHATLWSTLKDARGRIFGMFDSCDSGSMIVKSGKTASGRGGLDAAGYLV